MPDKFIRPFAGRPMISWPIETALASGLFARVIVSTEDEQIADVARRYGAEVQFLGRSATAGDLSSLIGVLAEVQKRFSEHEINDELICCLSATAALTTPARLHDGHRLIATGSWDSVFPVVAYSAPIQRALIRSTDGATELVDPGACRISSAGFRAAVP